MAAQLPAEEAVVKFGLEKNDSFKTVIHVRVIQTANAAIATVENSDLSPPYEIFYGDAKRSPEDDPNPEVSYHLALGRALQKMANKHLKLAAGLVKHADDVRLEQAKQAKNKKKGKKATG